MTADRSRFTRRGVRHVRRLATGTGAWLLLSGAALSEATQTGSPPQDEAIHFYSSAAPPLDYPGPAPDEEETAPLKADPSIDPGDEGASLTVPGNPTAGDDGGPDPESERAIESGPAGGPEPDPRRLATSRPVDRVPGLSRPPSASNPSNEAATLEPEADPIAFAMAALADCKKRFEQVSDYTCTFIKRERINGRLSNHEVMLMKARTRPRSVYFKFKQPNAGREAIFVHGHNDNKAIAHDVGIGRLLAGTVRLDPRSRRAMAGNRHPITEAGIGFMIETLLEGWRREMTPGESIVTIRQGVLVNKRPVTLIICNHPERSQHFVFHEVRLYIDQELGLPIRFEAYDWPGRPGAPAPLLEEYTYTNLTLNVGLTDHDFDPSNKAYSFGRF